MAVERPPQPGRVGEIRVVVLLARGGGNLQAVPPRLLDLALDALALLVLGLARMQVAVVVLAPPRLADAVALGEEAPVQAREVRQGRVGQEQVTEQDAALGALGARGEVQDVVAVVQHPEHHEPVVEHERAGPDLHLGGDGLHGAELM